jgi:signal transduction histidine kinase/DNA-binding response OmpR family regulator/ligand-binding sensor domain-containing protein
MNRHLVILGALLLLLPFSGKAAPELRFHTMPDATYYGGIHSIARDSVGRIWFSGYDAVYAFDGDRFIRMTELVTSQKPDDFWNIGFLTTDKDGRLYLATNQGLQRFDCAHGRFECIASGNIGNLESTADGSVWFICDGKVCSLEDPSTPSGRPAYPPGSKGSVIWPLPEDMDRDPRKLSLNCSGEHVWVASSGDLYRKDVCGDFSAFHDFGSGAVVDVLEAGDTVFVLTLSEGLYVCSQDGEVSSRYTLPIENDRASTAKQLYLGEDGILWVATQYGLMLVSPRSGCVNLLRANPIYPYSLPNNSVWSFFPDGEGRVWVGTYGGKLALAMPGDSDVDLYLKASSGGLGHPIVSCFCEDGSGRLWIGTEGGGITVWDRSTDKFSYYTQQDGSGLASNMVKKLLLDSEGNIWASFFNSGVQVFDRSRERWKDTPLTRGPKDSSLSVYDFVPDGRGGLWMSDPDADLMHASLSTGKVKTIHADRRRQVESVFYDTKGQLWVLTHQGAYTVDGETGAVVKRLYMDDMPYAVNSLSCALVASSGEIFFGTKGGGVNILSPDGSYVNHPMDGRTVFSMEEDPATGNVWMSTDRGLCYRTGGEILVSTLNSPSHCGSFYPRSSFCTSRGELLFGGTDGFILFRPGDLRLNTHLPKVFFTDLRINDKHVPTEWYTAQESPMKLGHKQSNVYVSFSSDSYLQSWNNRYSCRLRGLSDEWITLPPGQKSISYFNLSPGTYVFEVKASNNDGVQGGDISSLSWEIRPSPFTTWWATGLYILAVLGLAAFIWRFFTNRKIYRHELEMEQLKEKNMQELTKARINFFTNISHDLKTPLSLIVDPLRKLKEHLPSDTPATKYASLIEKSVGRMQRMIGQLLTFREIESDRLTLDRRPGDLVSFLESIFSLFETYADRKGIEMLFHSQFESYKAAFDHEVVEKIFTNLFSNAVKYTTVPGSISVNIRQALPEEPPSGKEGPWISITISNTGSEIPSEKRSRMFEAFNRDKEANPSFESSSGLGLAIVKELVNQVGGAVKVEYGNAQVVFTITLRLPEVQVAGNDTSSSYSFVVSEVDSLIEELKVKEGSVKHARKSTTVVVIDDNPELRAYLEAHLSVHYNVYTASDGAEGLEKVDKVHPQVVITDLMMDGTDGFAVCRSLRNSLGSSHIPVIVLSGDANNKVKALESGANVFIEKPFDMDHLLSQVEGLLRMQAEMREYYSKKFVAEPSKLVISSMDEALLSKAMQHIERNMDNTDYDVDEFVYDMAVGRTILYQKIKDITGMSIKEFIMDIRLKRAAQLLKDSSLTVSEISDRTGFANPKYFSVCFKRRFDISPSDFKKQDNPQ